LDWVHKREGTYYECCRGKFRRLTEWHKTLSDTVICGSLRAWLRTQLAEVDAMRTDGLIDAGEALELGKLADAAHTVLMGP